MIRAIALAAFVFATAPLLAQDFSVNYEIQRFDGVGYVTVVAETSVPDVASTGVVTAECDDADWLDLEFAVSTSDLPQGDYRVGVRVDVGGEIGCTRYQKFHVRRASTTVVAAEAFFDVDPGEGLGIPLELATPVSCVAPHAGTLPSGDFEFVGCLDVTDLSPGEHRLFARLRDDDSSMSDGRWGRARGRTIAIQGGAGDPTAAALVNTRTDDTLELEGAASVFEDTALATESCAVGPSSPVLDGTGETTVQLYASPGQASAAIPVLVPSPTIQTPVSFTPDCEESGEFVSLELEWMRPFPTPYDRIDVWVDDEVVESLGPAAETTTLLVTRGEHRIRVAGVTDHPEIESGISYRSAELIVMIPGLDVTLNPLGALTTVTWEDLPGTTYDEVRLLIDGVEEGACTTAGCEIDSGLINDCSAETRIATYFEGELVSCQEIEPGDCEVEFIRGDCNGDGVVGIILLEVTYLLDWAFTNGPPPPCEDAADADDDGSIDVAILDAVYLLEWAFVNGPPPPAPFPECGPDLTPDDLTCDSYTCP